MVRVEGVGWRAIREVLWMVWRMEERIWMSRVRLGFVVGGEVVEVERGTGGWVEGGILDGRVYCDGVWWGW